MDVREANAMGYVVASRSIIPNPPKTAITTIKPMNTAISDAVVMTHPFRHLRTLEDLRVSEDSQAIDDWITT